MSAQRDQALSISSHVSEVGTALDAALARTIREESQKGTPSMDLSSARYIIFSDLHRGARNGADDFLRAERAYNAALSYYLRMGHTLVVLGDVEELGPSMQRRLCRRHGRASQTQIQGRAQTALVTLAYLRARQALVVQRFARQLDLPKTGWVRRYRVRVRGRIDPAKLLPLGDGTTIDGVRYGPIKAELEHQARSNAWLSVALREGRNREVRKLCEHFGWPVTRLIRVSFGPFQLGHLPQGAVAEVPARVIRQQLGGEDPPAKAKHAHHRRQT